MTASKVERLLKNIIGELNVSAGLSHRQNHGQDCSYHIGKHPDLVAWPQSTLEVMEIAKVCSQYKFPIVAYGTGTGLEGGLSAEQGGLCLNLQKMDGILDYSPEDFNVTVQPGTTRNALNHLTKDDGLWFPIDPGADASLCGMCATGASGTNAVRYGTMKENTLNLQVVMADGSVIETAGQGMRAKKTSAGYDLTRLLVGSEGTLGIITSASLKLYARPEIQSAALTSFRSVEDAIKTVVEIFQHSVPMARIEFMDKLSMQICNAYSKTDYVEEPTLFLEFHGSSLAVEEQIRTVKDICRSHSGSQLKYAHNANERKRLWQARHDMHWAIRDYKPNYTYHGTDICVPISKLPEAIHFSQKYFQKIGVDAPVMGHVGDGNLHCNIFYDPNDHHFNHVQAAEMLALNAIKLGGTCTGEHGIGLGKKKLLAQQFGISGINTMKMIKGVLDPLNIMNPGKIL